LQQLRLQANFGHGEKDIVVREVMESQRTAVHQYVSFVLLQIGVLWLLEDITP
jgi:hypothetical protein